MIEITTCLGSAKSFITPIARKLGDEIGELFTIDGSEACVGVLERAVPVARRVEVARTYGYGLWCGLNVADILARLWILERNVSLEPRDVEIVVIARA